MKKYLSELLSNLGLAGTMNYILMALFTIAVPISWRFGTFVLMAMVLFAVIRCVYLKVHHQTCLSSHSKNPCYLLMIGLWVVYLLSLCLSYFNIDEGLRSMLTMLPLLAVPLFGFMLNPHLDTLHRKHITFLFYLLAATLTIRFIVKFIGAIIHYYQGTPINLLIDADFDPLHHNYLSLYILTAIALLYTELVKHWKDESWRRWRWVAIADIVVLVFYVVISESRTGVLIMAVLAFACMLHLAFVRKQWKTTGVILLGLLLFVGITYLAMPSLYWRVADSIEKMSAGEQGDVRLIEWKSGLEILDGHWALGYGVDGYWELLKNKYIEHDFVMGYEHYTYNTHNQFIETTLATGVVGLAVLLAMIILPLIPSFRKPRRNLPFVFFSIIYVGLLMFEVSFARQMGLLFICWWYCLLIYYRQMAE